MRDSDCFGDRGHSRSIGRTYDELVSDALCAPIKGWDFSWLTGQVDCDDLPWDYASLARDALTNATRLLDIDTGGGEVLASLAPLPAAIATEPYPPECAHRDRPTCTAGGGGPGGQGVGIARRGSGCGSRPQPPWSARPERDSTSSHTARRVSHPTGRQPQRPGLHDALGMPPPSPPDEHTLHSTVAELENVGLVIDQAQEDYPVTRYFDVGAVVFQLRSVPWQVRGFDVGASEERLRDLDAHIRRTGSFDVKSHRFLVRAHKS